MTESEWQKEVASEEEEIFSEPEVDLKRVDSWATDTEECGACSRVIARCRYKEGVAMGADSLCHC